MICARIWGQTAPRRAEKARTPAVFENDAGQEAHGVFGEVVERQPAFSFGGVAPATGKEPAEPAVGGAVGRQENHRRCIDGSDFGANQKFQRRRFRRDVRPHDPGETVAIGDGQCPIPQPQRRLHQLVGMRSSFQERKVRPAMQLGVCHARRCRESRDFRFQDRLTFRRRKFGHKIKELSTDFADLDNAFSKCLWRLEIVLDITWVIGCSE